MKDYLEIALCQADDCIKQALQCDCKSRINRKNIGKNTGFIYNPVLKIQNISDFDVNKIAVANTCFASVEIENQFVNFNLSDNWYQSAIKAVPDVKIQLAQPIIQNNTYPAIISPEIWQIGYTMGIKSPDIITRRDSSNSAWLICYTRKRLERFCFVNPNALDFEQKQLFLYAVSVRCERSDKIKLLAIAELCRKIWNYGISRLNYEFILYAKQMLDAIF